MFYSFCLKSKKTPVVKKWRFDRKVIFFGQTLEMEQILLKTVFYLKIRLIQLIYAFRVF